MTQCICGRISDQDISQAAEGGVIPYDLPLRLNMARPGGRCLDGVRTLAKAPPRLSQPRLDTVFFLTLSMRMRRIISSDIERDRALRAPLLRDQAPSCRCHLPGSTTAPAGPTRHPGVPL